MYSNQNTYRQNYSENKFSCNKNRTDLYSHQYVYSNHTQTNGQFNKY